MLVVVDEDVVPGDGAHVKCIQSTEYPEEGDQNERGQEHMGSSVEAAAAAGVRGRLLGVRLLLQQGQSVFVHLEMDVKALSSVLAILDSPRHCQEAVGGSQVSDQVGLFMRWRLIIVPEGHVDSMASNQFALGIEAGVEDFYSLLVWVNSKTISIEKIGRAHV